MFLRRGLVIYCSMLLRQMEANVAMSDGERKELDAIHEMVRKQKEKA